MTSSGTLFRNATTDGESLEITTAGSQRNVVIQGTFDGASVTLYAKTNLTDYQALRDYSGEIAAYNIDSIVNIDRLSKGFTIKATITSAGASTNITAEVL